MCISVFAVIKRRDKVLMGVPKSGKRWTSEWIPQWASYSDEERVAALEQWRLPSCYLTEGEHPDDAVHRVLKEQLRITSFTKSHPSVMSYTTPSDWYPGNHHWDLAFVYDAKVQGPVKKHSWWKELRFMSRSELGDVDLGWNDDFMRNLKLID
jgi:ADP-ribose pyrophosphatase YjhB (NUDIX family)